MARRRKNKNSALKNSAPKTDLGSCRYFVARHRHTVFPLWFFCHLEFTAQSSCRIKNHKSIPNQLPVDVHVGYPNQNLPKIIRSRSVVIIELDNQELLLRCIFVCKPFKIFFYATRCRLNDCCQSNAVSIVYPKGMNGKWTRQNLQHNLRRLNSEL